MKPVAGMVVVEIGFVQNVVRGEQPGVLSQDWLKRIVSVEDHEAMVEEATGEIRKVYVGDGLSDSKVDDRGWPARGFAPSEKWQSLANFITYARAHAILAADAARRIAAMEEAIVKMRQAVDGYGTMDSSIAWFSENMRAPGPASGIHPLGTLLVSAHRGGSWHSGTTVLGGPARAWTPGQIDQAFARQGYKVVGYPDENRAGRDAMLLQAADGTRLWASTYVQEGSSPYLTRAEVDGLVTKSRQERQAELVREQQRLSEESRALSSAA